MVGPMGCQTAQQAAAAERVAAWWCRPPPRCKMNDGSTLIALVAAAATFVRLLLKSWRGSRRSWKRNLRRRGRSVGGYYASSLRIHAGGNNATGGFPLCGPEFVRALKKTSRPHPKAKRSTIALPPIKN